MVRLKGGQGRHVGKEHHRLMEQKSRGRHSDSEGGQVLKSISVGSCFRDRTESGQIRA